jgi:hypothetical protein
MSAGASPPPVGGQLLERGWRQGALLAGESLSHAWSRRKVPRPGAEATWEIIAEPGKPGEGWVVATQDCDIASKDEPRLELLRAFWTPDRSLIRSARLNSARRFLLAERPRQGAKPEGLLADATVRTLVEKECLLHLSPASTPERLDPEGLRRFRQWLARRYDRPAIPNAWVDAIQKPLVQALRELKDDDLVWQCLQRVDEVRFSVAGEAPPLEVSLLFVRAAGTQEDVLGEADVCGWVAEVLGARGEVRVAGAAFRGRSAISLQDYLNMERLSLDEFSLEG